MNNDQDQPNKTEKINEKLEEVGSKAVGPNVSYGSTPGYLEDHGEEDAQAAAEGEGVKLYRDPDGSHQAVDESKIASDNDSND